MQFSQIAYMAMTIATSVIAHDHVDISALPSCALAPAMAAIGSTGCQTTDIDCICSDASFFTTVATAIQTTCSAADIATAQSLATALCADDASHSVSSHSVSATHASGVASATAGIAAATGVTLPTAASNGTVASGTFAPSATYTGGASSQYAGSMMLAAGLLFAL